jgi:RecB family endonuclease NucS
MRVVIARCSVDYEGRLSAHLPSAVRLIMVKADGCVAIHADGGAYKPLNWMNAPNRLIEEPGEWRVTNPKGDTLRITIDGGTDQRLLLGVWGGPGAPEGRGRGAPPGAAGRRPDPH